MEQGVSLSARPAWKAWALRWIRRAHLPIGWQWEAALPCLALALIAGGLRLALILRYPLLYDGDAYGRWLERDHPFDSPPWLPLFQLCIYLLTRLADSILAVRLLSAFFGVTATLAFWLLLRRAFGPAVAFLAALLLAVNPLFVLFTIVPYQEGLFLTLAFLALWLALLPGAVRWPWLVLVVGLAALTRYEGWLLAFLLWGWLLWRRWRTGGLSWRFLAGSALALGWAPLLWIALNRNVSPVGTQTLAPTLDPATVLALLHTYWLDEHLSVGLFWTLLSLAGLLWLGWRAARGSELAWLLLAFFCGDLLVIVFLRPFTPGNLRLPLLALPALLTGAAGLVVDAARLLPRTVWRPLPLARRRCILAGVFALLTGALLLQLVPVSLRLVAGYDALVRPAYLAAAALPARLAPGAVVAVLGADTDAYALQVYTQQDGRQVRLVELDLDTLRDPATLTAALSAVRASALVLYDPAITSATVQALARQGRLAPAGQGVGYAIWLVASARTS